MKVKVPIISGITAVRVSMPCTVARYVPGRVPYQHPICELSMRKVPVVAGYAMKYNEKDLNVSTVPSIFTLPPTVPEECISGSVTWNELPVDTLAVIKWLLVVLALLRVQAINDTAVNKVMLPSFKRFFISKGVFGGIT